MIETIKYGFYTVNPDYLEYLNQIDSEVYYNSSYRNSIKPFVGRLTYNKYRLYHAVTATQKTILKAFKKAQIKVVKSKATYESAVSNIQALLDKRDVIRKD
jgi:hypothetical protein fuD12_07940